MNRAIVKAGARTVVTPRSKSPQPRAVVPQASRETVIITLDRATVKAMVNQAAQREAAQQKATREKEQREREEEWREIKAGWQRLDDYWDARKAARERAEWERKHLPSWHVVDDPQRQVLLDSGQVALQKTTHAPPSVWRVVDDPQARIALASGQVALRKATHDAAIERRLRELQAAGVSCEGAPEGECVYTKANNDAGFAR